MNFLKKILKPTQSAIKTTLIITSSNGFHLRPIAKFVNEVKRFKSHITIIVNDREVLADQVPKILSLALEQGDSFTLKIEGGDASEATKHLVSFFHTLMQEDTKVEIAKQEEDK
jgi:phosphotransferase system HPr (HPr) family protein